MGNDSFGGSVSLILKRGKEEKKEIREKEGKRGLCWCGKPQLKPQSTL